MTGLLAAILLVAGCASAPGVAPPDPARVKATIETVKLAVDGVKVLTGPAFALAVADVQASRTRGELDDAGWREFVKWCTRYKALNLVTGATPEVQAIACEPETSAK
jgi:hypothetical protein